MPAQPTVRPTLSEGVGVSLPVFGRMLARPLELLSSRDDLAQKMDALSSKRCFLHLDLLVAFL
jgi:hypothetical protein